MTVTGYTDFAEKLLIALYQESENSETYERFADVLAKYGLPANAKWLERLTDEWESNGLVDVRSFIGSPLAWGGEINGAGMRYIESKYGSKDPVGTILEPVSEVERAIALAVPASDRIISLNHNQITSAERPVTELIDAMSVDNGDSDDLGLRNRLLGQLRAGRELLRAGEFRAWLLYETVVRALGEIIQKYQKPTIVALANALLGAIVSQMMQN